MDEFILAVQFVLLYTFFNLTIQFNNTIYEHTYGAPIRPQLFPVIMI